MPELAVILVNYKRPLDTIECVRSLEQSTYRNFATYVVDNGSGDGSPAALRSSCPGIVLLESPINLGFAGANNMAMERAQKEGADFFLLLNNDTVVDPSCLQELMDAAKRHPSAGVLGGKVLEYDRRNVIWFAGGRINVSSGRSRHIGIGERDDGRYDAERIVDFITGCCLLIRRSLYLRVGGLDTEYFAYYEDSDYCLRARRVFQDVIYAPKARVFHKVSSTSSLDGPVYLYFTLRNRLIFLRKHARWFQVIPYFPSLAYFYGRHMFRLLVRRRGTAVIRAAYYGFVDGLRGFTGDHGKGRLELLL